MTGSEPFFPLVFLFLLFSFLFLVACVNGLYVIDSQRANKSDPFAAAPAKYLHGIFNARFTVISDLQETLLECTHVWEPNKAGRQASCSAEQRNNKIK